MTYLKYVFCILCPGLNLGVSLHEDVWNTSSPVSVVRCAACGEPGRVCAVSALLLPDAWGFTHCTSARGHCACQSGQPAVKMLSAHSLLGFKEVGKEITAERAKNYFS